ncbi:unnamed protein product, partial [Rotaria sp. Silwood1]
MDSDKIVIMKDDIIVECGTPGELLTKQSQLIADMNKDDDDELVTYL